MSDRTKYPLRELPSRAAGASTRAASTHRHTFRPARSPWSLARSLSASSRSASVFLGLTAVRIALITPAILTHEALITSAALVVFIVWDIYDGKVARRFTVDSPLRRMVDAYTDRMFILASVCIAAAHDSRWLLFLILLAVRDGILWVALDFIYRRTGACLLGGRPNRQAAWIWAAWAFSAMWIGFNPLTLFLASLCMVVKFAVAANMIRASVDLHCVPPRVMIVDDWTLRR